MHRIDTSTAQKDKFGAGKNGFTRGNPQTGTPATDLDDDYFDSIQEELAAIIEASGADLDKSKRNQVLTAMKALLLSREHPFADIKADGAAAVAEALSNLELRESFSGVVGQSRNARMSVTTPSTSATFTATELIVEEGAGKQYRLRSFSKTINLATTGAGGMDTGSAPTTGYVALYAIYNPTTLASALLAVNATSTAAPEVYGGSNMPAGYTASALVSVWPISGGQLNPAILNGRNIEFTVVSVVNSSSAPTTPTPVSLVSAVPMNAKDVRLSVRFLASGGTGAIGYDIGADSPGIGRAASGGYVTGGVSIEFPPFTLNLITQQQCYHRVVISGATSYTYALYASGYSI